MYNYTKANMYTNVYQYGNKILVRGYKDGRQFNRKVDFFPTLFVDSKKSDQDSDWKTLDGKTVYPVKPGTIKETKEFLELYKDVHNFNIFGMTQYDYQYIAEEYPGDVSYEPSLIKIYTVDIETETEYGFPNVMTANERILLISVMDNTTKGIVTFGWKDYKPAKSKVKYVKCDDEVSMMKKFLQFWNNNCPDVITGWNVNYFDIPYIIRRARYLNADDSLLSPWKFIRDIKKYDGEEKIELFGIPGIAILDLYELYRKFTFTPRESYKLDYIAEVELGENKLENPYDSFKDFYTKEWDKFVDYNIHDVYLVDKLEDRLKLITLAFTLAYKAKVNFEDVYFPVRTWDILIYNYLKDKNIVIPLKSTSKSSAFVGGYVKEPLAGMHKWVASFDLTSLYPHIIMGYNMSPETLTNTQLYVPIDDLVTKTADTTEAHEANLSMAANGWCYRKDQRGFLPELMDQLYKDRKKTKDRQLELEKQYQKTKDPELEKEITMLQTLQMAIKVTLNSGYGAVTNQYFRYYDMRIGEGITITGQLASRWVARKLNEFMNKALKTEDRDYVIYSDTDSCYLSLEEFISQYGKDKTNQECIDLMTRFCLEVIQPYIDKSYQEMADYTNAYSQMMKMKLEVIADVGIFYKKKKYLLNVYSSEGVKYSQPKLKVVGLSMVQSSTPEICRNSLRESIKVVLNGGESDIINYTSEFKKVFNSNPVENIAFPRGVNGMDKFAGKNQIYEKGTPIAVRGALLYNHHLKRLGLDKKYPYIKNGEKVKFVYLKMPNPFCENVIAFPSQLPKEFGLHEYVDYDEQFNKAFKDALVELVKPMKWEIDEISSLENFFV